MQMPALALAAVAGRRKQTLELAQEIERRGFAGIYCASFGDNMGLCLSLAHATERIPFGTSVIPIYPAHGVRPRPAGCLHPRGLWGPLLPRYRRQPRPREPPPRRPDRQAPHRRPQLR
jgi:hypothetical protein